MDYHSFLSGTTTGAKLLSVFGIAVFGIFGVVTSSAAPAQAVALKLGSVDTDIGSSGQERASYATFQDSSLETAIQPQDQSYAAPLSREALQSSPLPSAISLRSEISSLSPVSAVDGGQSVASGDIVEGEGSRDISGQTTPTVQVASSRPRAQGTRALGAPVVVNPGVTPSLQVSASSTTSAVPEPLTAIAAVVGGGAVLHMRTKLSRGSAKVKK